MTELFLHEKAMIGPCMDVKAHDGLLYAIQRGSQYPGGSLCVLSADLTLLARYVGLGNARQIEIAGNVAVITAREDGLWLFDISKPQPRLLCHYQTVEYATGVALWANFAFISCRQYGVQVLDISNPRKPIHIAFIRIGEVQSATVADGILYGGVWGGMKVVVADVHDPAAPKVLTEIPLMGRGDGVHVKDGILYAATGQHARGLLNSTDHSDPAFGMGNGVERFDVRDPASPKRLNGRFLGKGYCVSVDMWEPALYGDTLVVNNSILGVFGLEPSTLEAKWQLLPPARDGKEDAVTGVTSLGGDLFVATAYGGLYAARKLALGEQEANQTEQKIATQPQPFWQSGENAALTARYHGSFPVLELAETKSTLALACGEGGVHLLDKQSLRLLAVIPTAGMAQDVKLHDDTLYVAEAAAGIEIFALNGVEYKKLGHFQASKPIYQLLPSESGRYLMCSYAVDKVCMLDISNPADVQELYRRQNKKGPLYGNNFATNKMDDGTMLLFWHQDGLVYTNPDKGDMEFHNTLYRKRKGFCGYCAGHGIETDGKHILYTDGDGYVFLPWEAPEYFEDIPVYAVEKKFRGLLTLKDGLMVAAKRSAGLVTVLDVKDLTAPRIIAKVETNASPSKAIFVGERIFLPGGRSGLLEMTLS